MAIIDAYDDLTVVIKTIVRYGVLRRTIAVIRRLLPTVRIIVVDDSPREHLQEVNIDNVEHVITDVDIGLSAGRNLGFRLAKTDFVMYTDDDQYPSMSASEFAQLMGMMREKRAALIGWRGYRHRPGKRGKLFVERIRLHPTELTYVDQTMNGFIASRDVLIKFPFNEKIKITGEHYEFFFRLSAAGVRIASHPYMTFKNGRNSSPTYRRFRNRNFSSHAKKSTGYAAPTYIKQQAMEPDILVWYTKQQPLEWMQELEDSNNESAIHTVEDLRDGPAAELAVSRDVVLRDWWRANRDRVNSSHLWFLSPAVYANTLLPRASWVRGMAGANVKRKGQHWVWFKQVKRLPAGLQPVGLPPFHAVVMSRAALDALLAPAWDEVFSKNIHQELRTPSLVASSGLPIEVIELPHVDWRENTPGHAPGIYSAVSRDSRSFSVEFKALDKLMRVLEDAGLKAFLAYGTALHTIRDGRLTRTFDHDMDVGVLLDPNVDARALLTSKFGKCTWGLGDFWRAKIRTGGAPIDVFSFGELDGYLYNWVGKDVFHKLSRDIVGDGRAHISVNLRKFNLPDQPFQYLEQVYGREWRVEKRNFNWACNHHNRIAADDLPALLKRFNFTKQALAKWGVVHGI